MDYEFSKEEIKEIVALSYEQGRRSGKGWYTNLGVKCVVNYWNEKHQDKPVVYKRIDLDSPQAEDALNKNYTLCTTYKGSAEYNLDSLKD